MKIAVGDLDRHITIQVATETKDSAGDPIQTWADAFKLWAEKREQRGRETAYTQQVIRDFDTVFTVRAGAKARQIAPESHRIVHRERVFEIVGVQESPDRDDGFDLLAAARPDLRGARGAPPDDAASDGASSSGGGDPAWLPPGAVVFMDFVNGHYFAGGVEQTLADAIDHTENLTVDGLRFEKTDLAFATACSVLGDFATPFLSLDFTVVVEAVGLDNQVFNYRFDPLYIFRQADDGFEVGMSSFGDSLAGHDNTKRAWQWYAFNGDGQRDVNETNDLVPVLDPFKVAATFTVAAASLSFQGGAVESNAAPFPGDTDADLVQLGGEFVAVPPLEFRESFGIIRSVTVYSPSRADADLPGLSV